jgi:hypothetical protein
VGPFSPGAAVALLASLPAGAVAQRAPLEPPCAYAGEAAVAANRAALEAHEHRRLDDASAHYAQALAAEPAREPTADERALIDRFAPRVFVTATEPFALKDVAVVLHPRAPWIAWHLLWDDDIDHPDDNDPCDHEVVWIRLAADRKAIASVYTYFHGRILANQGAGPAAVHVQWGKHGSLPLGWERLTLTADTRDDEGAFYPVGEPITVERYMRGTYEKLTRVGREAQASPLGALWPLRFTGTWADFSRFPRAVVLKPRHVAVSALNNPTLNRRFLRYNFKPKVEWPQALCSDLPAAP